MKFEDVIRERFATRSFKNEKVKKDLAKVIPHYMMPKYLKKLDEFPVNDNGKIDRKKLVDE